MKVSVLSPEFVTNIPADKKDGVLYVSMPYAMAMHRCCCGCGSVVVTPLSPTDWRLAFDGESISLDPSIGNWSFPCRSHYWISKNRVRWAPAWSQKEIEAGRADDSRAKSRHFERLALEGSGAVPEVAKQRRQDGLWKWLSGLRRHQ
jgi:hypothetical protein